MPIFLIDFDGTLCDSRPAIVAAMNAHLQTNAPQFFDPDLLLALIGAGHSIQECLAQCGVPVSDIPRQVLEYRKLYKQFEHYAVLYPGVISTLAALQARGHRFLLLSNKGQAAIDKAIQRFQLQPYFEACLAEQTHLPNKPDAAVFSARIAPLFPELLPSQCVMVGDTRADLQFAKNIGAKAAYAAYGYGHEQDCHAVGFDYRLSCFAELLKI